MKKAFILILVMIMAVAFAHADTAEARGKLGESFGYGALGIYKLDDADDDLTMIELGGQFAVPEAQVPVDIFASYNIKDGDLYEITALSAGANVQLPVKAPMKLYAGGGLRRVKVESEVKVGPWTAKSEATDTELFAQAGIEKDLDNSSAVNARAALEDLEDLVGYGEYIRWFSDKMFGFAGIGLNLSESDYMLYAGAAFGF
jgi:hypothetical protein